MRTGLLLLAVLLVAGCSGPAAAPDPAPSGPSAGEQAPASVTSTSAPPTMAPPPSTAPVPAADLLPRELLLTSCAGWQSGAYWPGTTPPAPNPASFAADERLGARVVMEAWECQRLNMTGFERGPVHLVLEYVSGLAVPAACDPAVNEAEYSLLQAFVDDAGLAAAFAGLGMPAAVAEVAVSQQDAGAGAAVHQWTWGPPGAQPSVMQVLDDGNTGPLLHGPFRFFWARGGGVAALDLSFKGLGMQSGERAATGELQPPMHLAGQYPRHAEFGEWMRDVSGTGSLAYWGDLACAQPL